LLVDVVVANSSKEVLYLQNWLYDWYGLLGKIERKHARPSREVAYACLGEQKELVLLSGYGPGPQEGLLLYALRRPYATRLPAGETYRGTLKVPLPAVEWYAYSGPQGKPTRPVSTWTVRYVLEAVRESHLSEPASEHRIFKGAYVCSRRASDILQARAHLEREIVILERTDPMKRFGCRSFVTAIIPLG
jgi:hypothetical protein